MNKYFTNITSNSADFYVYGTIVDEKQEDWFTGEKSETEVDPIEFKNELDDLKGRGIKDFNIYINSGGGSVFASSTLVSMIRRFRDETGAKIHSFIDGLCASASTYLCMVADEINVYRNSIMMIHKPMTFAMGNSEDLEKEINALNAIEDDMMIPMYMEKAKVDEAQIKDLIRNETWFSGNEKDDMFIGNFFKINYLDTAKNVPVNLTKGMLNSYKHIPQDLVENSRPKQQNDVVEKAQIDYSNYEQKLCSLKKEEC